MYLGLINKSETEQDDPKILDYVICYLIFFVLTAIAAVLLFRFRSLYINIGFYFGLNQVLVKGSSNIGILVTSMLTLIGVIIMEDYLRKGLQQGKFWRRVMWSLLIELGLFTVAMGGTLLVGLIR